MMRSASLLRRIAFNLPMFACSLALGAISLHGVTLVAQRGPVQRVVQGVVTDKHDVALNGAVVYLKDDRTLALKSFIADAHGTYRFGQLSQSTDYELWAESNGKKSDTRTISSFDTKNTFLVNLKIDTGK